MIDLMDDKLKKSSTTLWTRSEVPLLDTYVIVKNIVGILTLRPNKSTIYTHLGGCSHLKFKREAYTGFFTIFPAVYYPSNVDECSNNYFRIFYDDLGSDYYNILTDMDTRASAYTYINYQLMTIKRLNRKNRLCYNKEKFKKCKQDCLEQHLKNETLCKLPFIPNGSNLTTCTSSKMAKDTQAKFVKILTFVTLNSLCSCADPCEENVINMAFFTQIQREQKYIILAFLMFSNVVEHVIEVEKYSIIAFFSDVGNSFGLAVGMSLLTAAQMFRKLFSYITEKIFY